MDRTPQPLIIQGITHSGKAFRPSDWAERLCGVLSTMPFLQKMRYSPHVRPILMDGVRCVYVSAELQSLEPRVFRFLMDFARDNELEVVDESGQSDQEFCAVPGTLPGAGAGKA